MEEKNLQPPAFSSKMRGCLALTGLWKHPNTEAHVCQVREDVDIYLQNSCEQSLDFFPLDFEKNKWANVRFK